MSERILAWFHEKVEDADDYATRHPGAGYVVMLNRDEAHDLDEFVRDAEAHLALHAWLEHTAVCTGCQREGDK